MLRRVAPAIGLFLLSPLIGEYLLGNVGFTMLGVLVFLAPMYGAGALLVREVARRTGRGWPALVLLGLAYALIEEGLVIQSLFNSSYLDMTLLSYAHIPALGMGAWWTLFVLTLHTVWSTSVSIALMEALVPSRRTTPWLGKVGLTVTVVLYVLGLALTFVTTYGQERFLASAPKLVGAGVAVVLAIVAAFIVGRRPAAVVEQPAPAPLTVGVVAFVLAGLFMAGNLVPGWWVVAGYLVLFGVAIALISRWSRRTGWTALHITGLAGGALLTYAWWGFVQPPSMGAEGALDLVGNAVFAVAAVLLLVGCLRRVRGSLA